MRSWQSTILVLGLLANRLAFGWGDIGHGSVAEIAERYLSPEGKKFVQSILGPEPLAVAAVWPDQVRSDARFKGFAPYHFVEILTGNQYSPIAEKDGNTVLSQAPALIRSETISRERKMILLRYIVHVAGDVHQPLHVGNGQDMGANLCDVKWIDPDSYETPKPRYRVLNLHSVWDEQMIDVVRHYWSKGLDANRGSSTMAPPKRWFGYKELADFIMKDKASEAELEEASKATVMQWYSESRDLHSQVYPEAKFESEPKNRKYCKWMNPATHKIENGSYDRKATPTLDEAYAKPRTEIIKSQIRKGGLRLANFLNRLAAGLPVEIESETKIIESIQIKNILPEKEAK